jgi:FixJ family two-component response regulator
MYLLDLPKQEVRVLSQEDYMVIKALKKRGVYNVDIAAELGVHPKTVSRALRRAGILHRSHLGKAHLLTLDCLLTTAAYLAQPVQKVRSTPIA